MAFRPFGAFYIQGLLGKAAELKLKAKQKFPFWKPERI